MGFFDGKKKAEAPAPASSFVTSTPVADAPAKGTVNLSKGGTVNLSKSAPGALVTLTCQWPDTTDYDLYALVQYADGHVEHVSTFGATGIPAQKVSKDGRVVHEGDQARGDGAAASGLSKKKMAQETITVTMDPSITAVVPVVYSAQSNGGGSFKKYGVSSTVTCGDQTVTIDATNASNNDTIYTMIPAIVRNAGGVATLEAVEMYSKGGEKRPSIDKSGSVTMDTGPENDFK